MRTPIQKREKHFIISIEPLSLFDKICFISYCNFVILSIPYIVLLGQDLPYTEEMLFCGCACFFSALFSVLLTVVGGYFRYKRAKNNNNCE